MKVGINGFGRIGRAIYRINSKYNYFSIPQINDTNPDDENILYTLMYDSSYGRFKGLLPKTISHCKDITEVNWDVDILIDSSGVIWDMDKLSSIPVKHTLITNSSYKDKIKSTYVEGVNEIPNDKIISTSICDTVAFSPVAKVLDKTYGIKHVFITTLHPWLSYQHLLDGNSPDISYGVDKSAYVLGRASTTSLISKPTTVGDATLYVMPELKDKISCYSFRVPTAHVSASDLTFELEKDVTKEEINDLFIQLSKEKSNVYGYNSEPLVSIDFLGNEQSVVVDGRWTSVLNKRYLKLVIWYDNEWGYASKVVDLVRKIESSWDGS